MSQLPKTKKLVPIKPVSVKTGLKPSPKLKPTTQIKSPGQLKVDSPKPKSGPKLKTSSQIKSPGQLKADSPKPKSPAKSVSKVVVTKIEAMEDAPKQWEQDLHDYLRYELLPRAIGIESALDQLVSPENMKIWATAYTSEDYNPNVGENWEELELLGDRLLGYLFTKYLMESYPGVNRGQISILINVYLAKPVLAGLSNKLGMNKHILSRFLNTIHMMEDVFESTFGAIVKTGDTIKNGVGVGLAYNLFVSIFEEVEIDWKLARGHPKTQIKEAYEGMGWINPKAQEKVPVEFYTENGQTVYKILLNPIARQQLAEMGINVTSNVLGESRQSTKKKASDFAYIQALANLEEMGLTYEWIKQVQEQRKLENPELREYFPKVEAKMAQEGLVSFMFREERAKMNVEDSGSGVYVQLIGVDSDGKKRILAMTEEPAESSVEGKKQVLIQWTQ